MAKRQSTLGPKLAIAAVTLFLVGLGTRNLMAEARGQDGCLPGGADSNHVLLIDASDPLREWQLEQLVDLLREIVLSSGANDRFSIFRLGGAGESFIAGIAGACPNLDPTAGRVHAQRALERMLGDPILFLRGLSDAEEAMSPIREGLDVLLYQPELQNARKVHLTVVSDFLQHFPPHESHYPGSAGFVRPKTEMAAVCGAFPTDVVKSLRLVYVTRAEFAHVQTPEHFAYWMACGGRFSATPPTAGKL